MRQAVLRTFGGGLVGAALLLAAGIFSPPGVSATITGGGFCDETENWLCCCAVNEFGQVTGCRCLKTTAPEEEPVVG